MAVAAELIGGRWSGDTMAVPDALADLRGKGGLESVTGGQNRDEAPKKPPLCRGETPFLRVYTT